PAVDARPGDDDQPQVGHEAARGLGGRDDLSQKVVADAAATDGGEDNALVGPEAEPGADGLAIGEFRRVEREDVAREVEVLTRPGPDAWQPGSEREIHDIVGIAHEERTVTDPRQARDLLDHLGVAVRGPRGLARARALHRDPANEVGEPDERGALE